MTAEQSAREARWDIEDFHSDYAEVLERGDIEQWPSFFTEDAFYQVIARDNAESGLPLGLIYCEGKGMLKDRAYALKHTEMYAPRYLRLYVCNTRITGMEGALIRARASYLLLETNTDEPTRVHQAGVYRDVFERGAQGLLIKERRCIYDTVLVNNCLVFPV